jgi:hypothetical protein
MSTDINVRSLNRCRSVEDTDRWRQELAVLASASGIGIDKDDHKRLPRSTGLVDTQTDSRSGARYSARTGRFNEGTPKTRGRTGSKHGTAHSDALYNMPENERELWVSITSEHHEGKGQDSRRHSQ